jgi:hypothetical protein
MDYSIANRTPDVAQAVVPHSIDANGNAVPQSAGNPLPVGGASYVASAGFTRPADANAYTANDVVGQATGATAALRFPSSGPAAGAEILITRAQLEIDVASVPSGMTGFRLYLYGATPPSALGDNAAWDLPSGDRATFLGYVDLGTPVDLGSTLYVDTAGVNTQLSVPAGGAVFGYLVTNGGYTPGSGDGFKITLHAAGF